MLQQSVHGHAIALQHVKHAIGQPRLLPQLGDQQAHRGIFFRRLHKRNVFPHAMALANIHIGTIAGKIERRNPADYAQRLANLVNIDAAAGLLGETAFQQIRNAAANSIFSRPRATSPERVGHGLCRAPARDQLGQAPAIRVHQLTQQLKQNFGAARESRRPPFRKRLRRSGDRRVHFSGIGETDPGAHLTRGRIVDVAGAAGARGHLFAADPMVNCFQFYFDIRRCHRYLRKPF